MGSAAGITRMHKESLRKPAGSGQLLMFIHYRMNGYRRDTIPFQSPAFSGFPRPKFFEKTKNFLPFLKPSSNGRGIMGGNDFTGDSPLMTGGTIYGHSRKSIYRLRRARRSLQLGSRLNQSAAPAGTDAVFPARSQHHKVQHPHRSE